MEADTRKKIQLVLALAIAIAAIRTGYILYERKTESQPAPKQETALNPDYYVVPKKLYPYDLKSAKQLTKQPVWVKVGYSIARFPYNKATRKSDFAHEKGTLGPLQKIDIKDVVLDTSPGSPGQRQIMAVYEENGEMYSFPIGSYSDGNYHFISDDMLFNQDPHELYKHWPADIWADIDQHQVKTGMNQLQVDFAIGFGSPEVSSDSSYVTVHYPNGGKPMVVTYRNGKAAEIKEDKTSQGS
jgi:hypothetical protein